MVRYKNIAYALLWMLTIVAFAMLVLSAIATENRIEKARMDNYFQQVGYNDR